MSNMKTTLAGALAASGLGGAATLLLADDVKKAALALLVAALGAFLKGLFAQDAPPKAK